MRTGALVGRHVFRAGLRRPGRAVLAQRRARGDVRPDPRHEQGAFHPRGAGVAGLPNPRRVVGNAGRCRSG